MWLHLQKDQEHLIKVRRKIYLEKIRKWLAMIDIRWDTTLSWATVVRACLTHHSNGSLAFWKNVAPPHLFKSSEHDTNSFILQVHYNPESLMPRCVAKGLDTTWLFDKPGIIGGCSNRGFSSIQYYLLDCSWSSHLLNRNLVREALKLWYFFVKILNLYDNENRAFFRNSVCVDA